MFVTQEFIEAEGFERGGEGLIPLKAEPARLRAGKVGMALTDTHPARHRARRVGLVRAEHAAAHPGLADEMDHRSPGQPDGPGGQQRKGRVLAEA